MATALMVTFTQFIGDRRSTSGYDEPVGITSQCLTFVDVNPAQRALDAMKEHYESIADGDSFIVVTGTILKEVVI